MTPHLTNPEVRVSFADRRKSDRVPVALSAHCTIGVRHVHERVADISMSGFYLRTDQPVRVGTQVRASIGMPGGQGLRVCKLVGNVARVDRDSEGRPRGLGISLDPSETADHDRSVLRGFIEMKGFGLTIR